MKSLCCVRNDVQAGYILLPVVLLITLIAAMAFLINNDSVINRNTTTANIATEKVQKIVHAGLEHAIWFTQASACAGDFTLPVHTLDKGNYSATVTTPGGTTTSYSLPADQDAWFRSDSVTQNKGVTADMHIRMDEGKLEYSLYRFDLSSLPVGSQINSASAWLRVTGDGEFPEGPLTAHRVTADWTEIGATWDTMSTNFDSAIIASIQAQSQGDVWVQVNLTAQVQAWLNGGNPNFGIMLRPNGEGIHGKLVSREGSVADRPRLDVVVGTGAASPATINATGTLLGNPTPANDITRVMTRTNVLAYQPDSYTQLPLGAVNGEDAEIWDQAPDNNYGNAAETWVSSASSDTTRTLLRFNMEAIPVGARIMGATLSLYRQSGSGANQPVSAHRITNSWSESSVTWNRRRSGTNWNTVGGDFEIAAIATTPVGPTNQRYEWNITPLAQGWVSARYPNYGVVLVAAIAGMPGERFYTSDHADSSLHPRLSITYACECGQVCVSPQGSGKIALIGNYISFFPDPRDSEKKVLFESWGYDVDIYDDSLFLFNVNNYDVVYISETSDSSVVGSQLTGVVKGVVNEEGELNPQLELADGMAASVGDSVNIIDNSHYITAPFAAGPLPVYSAAMERLTVTGSLAGGLQTLAEVGGTDSLVVLDQGAITKGGGPVAGRRVTLPLGRATSSNFNWDYLNNNGRLIVQRAIQWAAESPAAMPSAKKLYWTDDVTNKIQRSDEDGSNIEDVITGLNRPTGLDIDTVNGKIYWTNNLQIRRADLDGSNNEAVYTGLLTTFDIKLDVAGGKMYWTHDNGNDWVSRADLDGSNSEVINTVLSRPAYITLDTSANNIYLTEFGDGDITRMNFDGSGVSVLLSAQTGAIGNALDINNGKMFWTGGSGGDWVRRADLNGANQQTIVTGLNAPQDIVYDTDNDRIYWVDALNSVLQRANSDGTDIETIVSGLSRPRAIVIVSASQVPPTGGGSGSGSGSGCDGTFRDEFNAQSYTGSDGSLSWATNWQETGELTSPTSGDIRIINDIGNYQLLVRDDGQTVMREVDLSNAVSAILSFDYRRENLSGSSDYVSLQVSYNGGTSWAELDRFTGTADDASYTSTSYVLNAASLSSNTLIRFLTPLFGMSNSNGVMFDNVQIQCGP